MKFSKLITAAALAAGILVIGAPAQAQVWRNGQRNNDNYRQVDRSLKILVDRTEKESNSFREFFERNYKERSRYNNDRRNNGNDRWGNNGRDNYSLKESIQRLDEAMERLRREVDRNGRSRQARQYMDEVVDRSNYVNREIARIDSRYDRQDSVYDRDDRGRGRGNGNGNWNGNGNGNGRNRDWYEGRTYGQYGGSLSSRWQDLRQDINDLARAIGSRGW